jgi:hypothetical protein
MISDTVVGLDVHADSITAAILRPGSEQPEVMKLSSDLMKVRRLFRRLSGHGPVRSCYEASGAGFVLQRVLAGDGFSCDVIAPSLIPRKPGERRKTDRLDAVMLARLYRSGHLTPVHVPPPKIMRPSDGSSGCVRPITSTSPLPCTGSQASCGITASSLGKANPPGPKSTACGLPDFA